MLNKILLSVSIVLIFIGTSYGSVNNTITSKGYVDTEIETKQLTIPVTGINSSNAGNTVVTYTSTEGTLGERGLYTGANTYDAETDADKLITASALNTAFTTLPTLETNRLACANPGTCDLWTITPQTAYGRAGNACPDLMSLIGDVRGVGYGYISNDGIDRNNENTYGLTQNGTFVVDYGDGKKISGKTQCSTQSGTNNGRTWTDPTISSTLPDSSGQYCWCQLDGYTTTGDTMQSLSAPWVFYYDDDYTELCEGECAAYCANALRNTSSGSLNFRAAVFGSLCD